MRRRSLLCAGLAAGGPWHAGRGPGFARAQGPDAAAAAGPAGPWQDIDDTAVHDPTLWADASGLWVLGTGAGLGRLHSPDGRRWRRLPPVFGPDQQPAWWRQQVPEHDGRDLWAPKLFAHRDRLWLMYSVSTFGKNNSAIGLASAPAAAGPGASAWRDDGLVLASRASDSFNAIDPDVMADADGRLWLAWGSWWQGLQVSALDADTLRPTGPPQGVDSSYEVRVGRAPSPTGPFVDRDGRALMDGGGSAVLQADGRWRGPGHQDVSGDRMVWHAYDAQAGGQPRLRLGSLRWDADAWPRL